MKITTAEVAHVAALANLEVSGEHARLLAEQLSRIVLYVEQLSQLDTDGVEPTTQITLGDVREEREDRIEPRDGTAEAGKTVRLFKVPRVIGGR